MEKLEILELLDKHQDSIVMYFMGLDADVQRAYLKKLINPSGHYCKEILSNPSIPLEYKNLVFLLTNLFLDIEELHKAHNPLAILPAGLVLYEKLGPALRDLLTNKI